MDNVFHQFENDILGILGMQGRDIRKLVLTFEHGQIPTIEISEFLLSTPDVLVTKTYTVAEVN